MTDCVLKYIQEDINNQGDYVELGLACAKVCTVLERGLSGRGPNDLNDLVREVTGPGGEEQLTPEVEEVWPYP